MNANEFIEKVRGLVLKNAEINKTVRGFFREHPECWAASRYADNDEKTKLVGLNIGINFHAHDEQIEKARPWFSISFGYSNAELKHSETLHENPDTLGEYLCYVSESDNSFILKDKVNW